MARPHLRVEAARTTRMLHVDRSLCLSCGACASVCPPDALFLAGYFLTIDTAACTGCARCTAVCPSGALSFHGERLADAFEL